MAQTLPKMVTAKSGAQYDAASPQGQMIVNAAKPAFDSDSKILSTISTNVISIGESVAAMVMIAQADARGDALNKSNFVQDDLGGAPAELTSGQMRDRGEGGGDDGGLGGLMGIGAMVGGFGKGLSFWGTPLAIAGALSFTVFLGGLIGLAYVGARTFNASSGEIAEGMETLSNADVDTDKVILMGEALAKFGLAMGAEGLGAGIGSLGNLVSGIADGFAGFLGIEKKDPMVALKAFAQHDITEDEVKQIELNARALTVFSGAMAVNAGADFATSVGNLASGVVSFVAGFFPEKEDPMLKMIDFASHKIDQTQVDQIILNSAALVGFSTVMATVKAINVVENLADLASGVVSFATSFFPEGKDPMIEMKKFAGHEFTQKEVDQIKLNAGALLAFSSTMAIAKPLGTVAAIGDLFTGIATGVSKFFGLEKPVPMEDMRTFASHKFTQDEVDQIELNANALVNFSKAMALYSASGAGAAALDLVGSIATGITNFFDGTTGIDYEEIKTFANSGIGEYVDDIDDNLKVIESFLDFSTAVRDFEGVDFKHVNAFSSGLVTASHGISYALHGGAKKFEIPGFFNDITIKPGEGLASIESFDMQNAAQGIAVLRHSLSAEAPLEALKEAAAVMNTADGGVTIVNAPQTSTTSNVQQGDTVISELGVFDANQMYMQYAFMSSMPSLR